MDPEREYSPVLPLTTKQSRKASWKKELHLQEGLGRGNYQHKWGKPEGPGIWTLEVGLKPWASGELQQVLEPVLEQNLTVPTCYPHKSAMSQRRVRSSRPLSSTLESPSVALF